jgi:hypothetical protein
MYVEPIGLGSTSDYSWITATPTVRNTHRNKQINPFNPDGTTPNPLRDLVTLRCQSTRDVLETTEFSPVFNSIFLMFPNERIRQFAGIF